MSKKRNPDSALLSAINIATKPAEGFKQKPAGHSAVKKVIEQENKKATEAYNIRLSQVDAQIIEDMITIMRQKGKKRASSADVVRVALRTMTDDVKNDPILYLGN